MQEQQLTLNEMKRGSLYYNEAKGRTERYIGNVSPVRPCYGLPQAGAGSVDDS